MRLCIRRRNTFPEDAFFKNRRDCFPENPVHHQKAKKLRDPEEAYRAMHSSKPASIVFCFALTKAFEAEAVGRFRFLRNRKRLYRRRSISRNGNGHQLYIARRFRTSHIVFVKTLLLLPFRGLLWLLLGLLCSSVWLLIAALFTTSYWLPSTLSWLWETKTDFPCKIESAKIDWRKGKICLKNVTLYNPTPFQSSDMASFSKIECRFDWLSLPKQTLHVEELNFFGTKLASIEQSENNNWAMLNRYLNTHEKQPTKGVWVKNLRFTFDGVIAHHSYRGTPTVSVTKRTRSFEFSNLCINVPRKTRKHLYHPCDLKDVYRECKGLLMNN